MCPSPFGVRGDCHPGEPLRRVLSGVLGCGFPHPPRTRSRPSRRARAPPRARAGARPRPSRRPRTRRPRARAGPRRSPPAPSEGSASRMATKADAHRTIVTARALTTSRRGERSMQGKTEPPPAAFHGNTRDALPRLSRYVGRHASPHPPRRPSRRDAPDRGRRQARPSRLLQGHERRVAAPALPQPEAEADGERPALPDRGRPARPRRDGGRRPGRQDRRRRPLQRLGRPARPRRHGVRRRRRAARARARHRARPAARRATRARPACTRSPARRSARTARRRALLATLGFRPLRSSHGVVEYELEL